jgi:hypothetical protein
MVAPTIFARITPKSIKVTETYEYSAELAKHEEVRYSREPAKQPTGKLEVIVPYDGERYFTEEQRQLIEWQAPQIWQGSNADICIGYLGFSDYGATNLEAGLGLRVEHDTIALNMPIRHDQLPPPEELLTDRHLCKFTHNYQPRAPAPAILAIEVELFDETTLDGLQPDLWDRFRADNLRTPDLTVDIPPACVEALRTFDGFDPHLHFNFRLILTLAGPLGKVNDPAPPVLEQITLQWPVMLSTRRLALTLPEAQGEAQTIQAVYLAGSGITCANVMLLPPTESQPGKFAYRTPLLRFSVTQPNELYHQRELHGSAAFKLAGALSGLQLTFYDATGQPAEPQTVYESKVILSFSIDLAQRFQHKQHTPSQVLQFEGVLLDQARAVDVENVLQELGFDTRLGRVHNSNPNLIQYIVVGRCTQGTGELWLWLLVEGRVSITRRQRLIPGSQSLDTTLESGHVTIHMRGKYNGSFFTVNQRMNQVQQRLKQIFRHINTVD